MSLASILPPTWELWFLKQRLCQHLDGGQLDGSLWTRGCSGTRATLNRGNKAVGISQAWSPLDSPSPYYFSLWFFITLPIIVKTTENVVSSLIIVKKRKKQNPLLKQKQSPHVLVLISHFLTPFVSSVLFKRHTHAKLCDNGWATTLLWGYSWATWLNGWATTFKLNWATKLKWQVGGPL